MRSPATQSEAIAPSAARDLPGLSLLSELPVSQPDFPSDSAGGNASTPSVLLRVLSSIDRLECNGSRSTFFRFCVPTVPVGFAFCRT